MNLAELPESLITLHNLAPENAQAPIREFIANDDRMKICMLLIQHVSVEHNTSALLDDLVKLIDAARREGYSIPEE